MMLEMDNSELLMLLESEQQLKAKVEEALRVLQQAQQTAAGPGPGPQQQQATATPTGGNPPSQQMHMGDA